MQLLISLGAEVNTGILASYAQYAREDQRQSILDWVNVAIQVMEVGIKRTQKVKQGKPVDLSKLTSWREYASLTISITNRYLWTGQTMIDRWNIEIERMKRTKQYFEDVRELLVSIGAKTWSELGNVGALLGRKPAKLDPEKEASFDNFGFTALSESPFRSINVPRHLIPRYHELCEACLNGDNEKIQALCLPPEAAENAEIPLQITVTLSDAQGLQDTGLLTSFSPCIDINFGLGLTPFSIAVERRKWDTARLILAIAVAQYEADEKDVVDDVDIGKSAGFNTSVVHNGIFSR